MPLTADQYQRNRYGDLEEDSIWLDDTDLRICGCEGVILQVLIRERMPEEAERDIIHWYGQADAVKQKVESVEFMVEEREHRLWGLAQCRVCGSLTAAQLDTLKYYDHTSSLPKNTAVCL